MFDFDAGKLVIIGIVALIVIGPKDLPRVLRQVGQAVSKMRRLAADFQGQFMEAMREADVADIKADVAKLADSAKLDVDFHPVRDIRNHITSAVDGPASVAPLAAEPAMLPLDAPTTAPEPDAASEATAIPPIGPAEPAVETTPVPAPVAETRHEADATSSHGA